MVIRLRTIVVWFATVGFLIPIAIIVIDRLSAHGWWAHWVLYVFPSSYMIGAASGIIDSFFYEMAAIAIVVNIILYSIAGLILGIVLRLIVRLHQLAVSKPDLLDDLDRVERTMREELNRERRR
jgi:hypothetical protein